MSPPMAKLRFTFGTMGSGKSTQALQIHHNLRAQGLSTILMTQLDRREGRVSSRLGVSAGAEIVGPVLTSSNSCVNGEVVGHASRRDL